MEIRIKTLQLSNFKGVRSATFYFQEGDAVIEGDNGTGKSTVFDAFTWLLFGKDHRGQDWTSFDIKPIDPETREPIHNLDTWVEAFLTVDGTDRRLRRVISEDWVKPRGQAERVFKGHKQSFFVDGIDVATKKAYDETIAQWIDEGTFRLITNPLHFIDDRFTDWKTRRKLLMTLADGDPASSLEGDFADLLAEAKGEPREQFRKRVAAERKANKDSLAEAEAKVKAYREAMPREVDTARVSADIEAARKERDDLVAVLESRIATIDAGIADINAANAANNDKISDLRKRLIEVRRKERDIVDEAMAEAREAAGKRDRELADLRARLSAFSSGIAAHDADLGDLAARRDKKALTLKTLGERYETERGKAFAYSGRDVCPACGRPLPPETVEAEREAARTRFMESRRGALNDIVDEANAVKADIARIDSETARIAAAREAAEAGRREAQAALAAAESSPKPDPEEKARMARQTEGYMALAAEDRRLERESGELSEHTVSVADLLNDRRSLEREIRTADETLDRKTRHLNDLLAVDTERRRIQDMIAKTEKAAQTFADAVARLERLDARAVEYAKAMTEAVEGTLNSRFRETRWRMFGRTLEGNLTETCEATTLSGVPYGSMNDAQRIICGMDVIRAFSGRSGCVAPIFIDNAESVTREDFGVRAQVIRLVVKAGSPLVTINTNTNDNN